MLTVKELPASATDLDFYKLFLHLCDCIVNPQNLVQLFSHYLVARSPRLFMISFVCT